MYRNQMKNLNQQITSKEWQYNGFNEQTFTRSIDSWKPAGETNDILEFIGKDELDISAVRYLSKRAFSVDSKNREYCWNFNKEVIAEINKKLAERKESIKQNTVSDIVSNDPKDYIAMVRRWTKHKYNCFPQITYDKLYMYNGCFSLRSLGNTLRYTHSCQLKLECCCFIFDGFGNSASEAEKDACRLAYEYIKNHGDWFSIKDELDDPNEQESIGRLEILARRGYFEIPRYEFNETYDKDGNPVWKATCIIDGLDKSFSATSSSKKEAKKKAAYKMLNYVLSYFD